MDREAHEESFSSPSDNLSIEKFEYIGASCDTCRVTVTGGSFFFLFTEKAEELRIFESKTLTDNLAEALLEGHREYLAYRKAFDFIARREHSEEMLKLKLKKRGFPDEACLHAVERLRLKGLVDDERFAQQYMESVFRRKNEGRRKLAARLMEKGIARELADRIVSGVSEEEEIDALAAAGEKLLRKRKDIPKEKLYNSLLAKGFQYSDIRRFIEEKISCKN